MACSLTLKEKNFKLLVVTCTILNIISNLKDFESSAKSFKELLKDFSKKSFYTFRMNLQRHIICVEVSIKLNCLELF